MCKRPREALRDMFYVKGSQETEPFEDKNVIRIGMHECARKLLVSTGVRGKPFARNSS